jgi:Trypsin-co-occurring domain 2
MTEPDSGLQLAETIQQLREELATAIHAGEGQPLKFKLDTVELELKLLVSREGKGKAGVKFWVVDAGVEGAAKREQVQTIKLKLTPVVVDPTGGQHEPLVSDPSTRRRE